MLEDVQVAGYWYDAACMVPELSQEVIATLVSFTRDASLVPSSQSAVLLFPLGGACAEAAVESTSFWGAGARGKTAFWIIIQGGWTPDAAKDPEGERRATVARYVKGFLEPPRSLRGACYGPSCRRAGSRACATRSRPLAAARRPTPSRATWRGLTLETGSTRFLQVGRLVVVLEVCEPRHLRVLVFLFRQVVDERDLRTRATPDADSIAGRQVTV